MQGGRGVGGGREGEMDEDGGGTESATQRRSRGQQPPVLCVAHAPRLRLRPHLQLIEAGQLVEQTQWQRGQLVVIEIAVGSPARSERELDSHRGREEDGAIAVHGYDVGSAVAQGNIGHERKALQRDSANAPAAAV